jgi:GT2 family glycosyltransferase
MGSVAVGYLYGEHVAAGFANSLAAMLWQQGRWGKASKVAAVRAEPSGVNVSAGRNSLVRWFLDGPCEWLLMLDADMTFKPDLPDALLANASAEPGERHAPIVGALCFGVDDGRLFPTMYDFTAREDGGIQAVRYNDFPREAMFQVGATGAAALLVHRSALEAIRDRKFNATFPWFQETDMGGERYGEDVTFCLRAAACGLPVYVDTGVAVGHQKAQVLTAELFESQRGAARDG